VTNIQTLVTTTKGADTMELNGIMMQYFHWYYGNRDGEQDLWEKVKCEVASLGDRGSRKAE